MKIIGIKNIEFEKEKVLSEIDDIFEKWFLANTPKGVFQQIYADKISESNYIIRTGKIHKDAFFVFCIDDAKKVIEKNNELKSKIGKMESYRLSVKELVRKAEHVPDIHTLLIRFKDLMT